MRQVHKYHLRSWTSHEIQLPVGAKIVHVGDKDEGIHIWVEVDVNQTCMESRIFSVFGTGHSIEDDDLQHIGTVVESGGYVWHIYENVSDRLGSVT